MKPWAAIPGGVRMVVRLTPRAARNGIDRIAKDADGRLVLKLRLTAPPVEGAANDALVAWLAGALGMRKADIKIRSGESGRTKILELAGDAAVLFGKLAALCSP